MAKPMLKGKLLIIDDDQSIRDSARQGLEDASLMELDIFEAENTHQGLRMVQKHHPDVIVLDLHFSNDEKKGQDGFYFLNKLRSDPASQNTRVIMMTIDDSLDNMRAAEDLEVSAYNFIGKPFNLDDLIGQVYSALTD